MKRKKKRNAQWKDQVTMSAEDCGNVVALVMTNIEVTATPFSCLVCTMSLTFSCVSLLALEDLDNMPN